MSGIPRIQLEPVEQELRKLLLDVAKHINPEKPSQLRFTGGWVRDKLLGVRSHDIDVGINDMTGEQFGMQMKDYLELPGKADQYGLGRSDVENPDGKSVVRSLHKIEANPEKSKHLETITTKIFGLDIDLVNLRKETYTEDSRNPQMEFGTPEEDALRRDATINAMFYNIQDSLIEDFTGRGWDDMQARIIRTPLDPYQTFKDDPLRVLRLIRFAARLDYSLDPESEKYMQDESIKQALQAKISRERVGVEIEKMLRHENALVALKLLDRLSLYTTVFSNPGHQSSYQPEVSAWPTAYDMAEKIVQHRESSMSLLFEVDAVEQVYVVRLLSAARPWLDAPLPPTGKAGSKPPPLIGVEVFRNGVKATNKVCDITSRALQHAQEIIDTKSAFIKHTRVLKKPADSGSPAGRDTLGMLIRNWGASWRAQCAFAMMVEATNSQRPPAGPSPLEFRLQLTNETRTDIINEYALFLEHIAALSIQETYALKPIIDGHALAKAMSTPPGPWMKSALERIIAYQLAQPLNAILTPDAAVAALQSHQSELTSALQSHVLALTVRPLFAQTQAQTAAAADMTTQARARMAGAPPTGGPHRNARAGIETFEEADARRPWKLPREEPALRLLEWCVAGLCVDTRRAEREWKLLVPPVLTLMDDVDVRFKARGCRLMRGLLAGTEPAFLGRTGLGRAFHDALAPCASYLPTLTPEADAADVVDSVYPALLQLARVRFPGPERLDEREAYLAEVLHKHLLPSFGHCPSETYPALTTALLVQLSSFSDALRLGVVAHLQDVIPLISSVLSAPFGSAAPGMIAQAARTMSTVLDHSWPRAWRWRGEVFAGACRAWIGLAEDGVDGAEIEEAKREVRNLVQLLVDIVRKTQDSSAAVEVDVDAEEAAHMPTRAVFRQELHDLQDASPLLEGLFADLSIDTDTSSE